MLRCTTLIGLAAACLTGCLGTVEPLYTGDLANVHFTERLLGDWQVYAQAEPGEITHITIAREGEKGYRIGENEAFPARGDERMAGAIAHFVDIAGHRLLDLRQLPREEKDGETASERDLLHYPVLVKEIVFDSDTGGAILTLGIPADAAWATGWVERNPDAGVTTRRIEQEGNKPGTLVLEGPTPALHTAMAAFANAVTGFGLEIILHLEPEARAEAEPPEEAPAA